MREAYECHGLDRVRITFDRDLHYGVVTSLQNVVPTMWWPVRLPGVIFEVKFTGTYPFWVADFIRCAELIRRGVCKYKLCADAAGIQNHAIAG
jgi:hypothetical protein